MLGIIVDPLVLCMLVWIVARDSADVNFAIMFFICLGVGIAGFVLGIFIGPWAVIPVTLLLGYLLMKHFYLTLNQAIVVLLLFDAIHIGVWYLTSK